MKKKTKIMVIGGLGFIGKQISDLLAKSGYQVIIVDNASTGELINNQQLKDVDINNTEELCKVMKGVHTVFHFAGIADIAKAKVNPRETIQNNILGTVSVIESVIKQKVKKLFFASTMYVYSDLGSFYRASKQACEIILQSYAEVKNLNYTVLRYGSLYGPRAQKWNGIQKYVEQIISTNKIIYSGNGYEKREYIHVLDAARLSVRILDKQYKNQAITITGNQNLRSKELLEMIFEILKIKKNIKFNYKKNDSHYDLSPYNFTPLKSVKIVPDQFTDIGQGILEIIETNYSKKN